MPQLTNKQWLLIAVICMFIMAIGPLNLVLILLLIMAEAVLLSLAMGVLSGIALICWLAFKFAGRR